MAVLLLFIKRHLRKIKIQDTSKGEGICNTYNEQRTNI